MEKGKIKNSKKYISVLFVPHFSAKVKTIRFSANYSRLLAAALSIFLAAGSLAAFTIYTAIENKRLKDNVSQLCTQNIEQQKLLMEKSKEVSSFIEKEDEFNSMTENFMEKYREITDNYINDKISSIKTNRSGESDMRSFVSDINELKAIASEMQKLNESDNKIIDEISRTEARLKEYIDAFPSLWPVHGTISSHFGKRRDPFVWRRSFHTGIDIAADYGVKIKAAANGKVVLSKRINVYGNAVIINHGHGISTFYGHASKLLVKEGQTVKKGESIAQVGSSGRSTGSHLHFEVRVNGNQVDPLDYLDKK